MTFVQSICDHKNKQVDIPESIQEYGVERFRCSKCGFEVAVNHIEKAVVPWVLYEVHAVRAAVMFNMMNQVHERMQETEETPVPAKEDIGN